MNFFQRYTKNSNQLFVDYGPENDDHLSEIDQNTYLLGDTKRHSNGSLAHYYDSQFQVDENNNNNNDTSKSPSRQYQEKNSPLSANELLAEDDEDFENFENRNAKTKSKSTLLSCYCCKYLSNNKFYVRFRWLLSAMSDLSHRYSLKNALLTLYSVVCVVLFSLKPDEHTLWSQTTISNSSVTQLPFTEAWRGEHGASGTGRFYKFKLDGPFITEEDLSRTKINSGKYVNINVYSVHNRTDVLASWTLVVNLPSPVNQSTMYGEIRLNERVLTLKTATHESDLIISVDTNEKNHLSFVWTCARLGDGYENSIIYASVLLIFVYVLIMFELTHRAIAAFLGSLGAITIMSMIELEKPTVERILTWIEWETILLMFGMMIIVGIFCETGLFDLIAFRIFHYSGSRIWIMISLLCLLSALLSAFLDNVTTILLLTPITIRLCEVMSLEAKYVIIAEVIFSNIGGVATAIGDPPNVIITANQIINSKGVDFTNFTGHMFVGFIFIYASSFLQFRLLFLNPKFFLKKSDNLEDMNREISIWKRTYQSIVPITKEEKIVRTLLKEKVSQLENVMLKEWKKSELELEQSLIQKSREMMDNYRINDRNLLVKSLIVFSVTLILFFTNSFVNQINLTIGWISILSALVLLVASLGVSSPAPNAKSDDDTVGHKTIGIDFDAVLHKVEWGTLLFFTGLFIFMKALEELGLLNFLADLMSSLIRQVNSNSDRLVFAILVLILISAFISSIIDNIPFTTAMIPIIIQLSEQVQVLKFLDSLSLITNRKSSF